MTNRDHEYDVAFSFHSQDEGLATALNDLLQERFKSFLYSRRQEVLAGTDGEKTFNAVFGEKARCVVVFCRKEWGHTPFTRIEETAIRNRGFNEGYEFTLFIPTDDPPTIPPWLPKTRLYYGLSRFGLQGAAAVVEQRIQELGGEPTVERVQDRAARLQRARDLEKARKQFCDGEGVRHANEAVALLTTTLQARSQEIAASNPALAGLNIKKVQDYWLISGIGLCVVVQWCRRYNNSLDGASLKVDIYRGVPRLPGLMLDIEDAVRLNREEYTYELVHVDHHGFVRGSEKRVFNPEELADHVLASYMDAAERHG